MPAMMKLTLIPEYQRARILVVGRRRRSNSQASEDLMPRFYADFCARQPYRIVLITERAVCGQSFSRLRNWSAASCSR